MLIIQFSSRTIFEKKVFLIMLEQRELENFVRVYRIVCFPYFLSLKLSNVEQSLSVCSASGNSFIKLFSMIIFGFE